MTDFYTGAVILAAGASERFGRDKIMLELNGRHVIEYSLLAFERACTVDETVVVAAEAMVPAVSELVRERGFRKVSRVVAGADSRVASAACGLAALSCRCRYICVHDGARPLITPEDIDKVNRAAYEYGAVFCGTRVTDTIKSVDEDGVVLSTLDRGSLRAAATPQSFEIELYRRAVSAADGAFTDDAGMVEAMGEKVRFVECRADNYKITLPEDVQRISRLLE